MFWQPVFLATHKQPLIRPGRHCFSTSNRWCCSSFKSLYRRSRTHRYPPFDQVKQQVEVIRSRLLKRVEWKVDGAAELPHKFLPGQALLSPFFAVAGIDRLRFQFFPSGYLSALHRHCPHSARSIDKTSLWVIAVHSSFTKASFLVWVMSSVLMYFFCVYHSVWCWPPLRSRSICDSNKAPEFSCFLSGKNNLNREQTSYLLCTFICHSSFKLFKYCQHCGDFLWL